MSSESREESRDPIDSPVRVAVVLSQGNRVLRPEKERKPQKATWNNWFAEK